MVDARVGHQVVGTARTKQGGETLHTLGSKPEIVDVFDAEALSKALLAVQPEIIIHQLTGLSAWRAGRIEEAITQNARVRTEGTRNLVKAALAAATQRLIAQSIAYAPGILPHTETDPLDVGAQGTTAVTVRGVMALDRGQRFDHAALKFFVTNWAFNYLTQMVRSCKRLRNRLLEP